MLKRPVATRPFAGPPFVGADTTPRYRVEFLIVDPVRSAASVRDALAAALGRDPRTGTIAVAGNLTLIKAHVTTARPEIALAIGRAAGTLADVIFERLGATPNVNAAASAARE